MSNQPPNHFTKFSKNYPDVAKAYSELGDAVHESGPIDEKTRALIKIAISGGSRTQGAFHAHVRKARILGISYEEIRHVALMSWIDDVEQKA